jgi:hypothetical protein
MCFGSLNFVVTTEGDLERALALVPPSPTTGLDTVVETLEGLRLHPSESRTLEHGQLDNSGRRRSEHQPIIWGFFSPKVITRGLVFLENPAWGTTAVPPLGPHEATGNTGALRRISSLHPSCEQRARWDGEPSYGLHP